MICHNKRITEKRKIQYIFNACFAGLFILVILLGYVAWDFYESRQAYKITSHNLAECFNGKVILADGIEFQCKGKEINIKKGAK